MFPSSKKKRLCRVNRGDVVDCGELEAVFTVFTAKSRGFSGRFSPVTTLESLEGAVSMLSRSRRLMVDGDGDSAMVETVGEC